MIAIETLLGRFFSRNISKRINIEKEIKLTTKLILLLDLTY